MRQKDQPETLGQEEFHIICKDLSSPETVSRSLDRIKLDGLLRVL